jgi:hypothetical protein
MFYSFFLSLRQKALIITKMTISEFFHTAPVLATLLTLGYSTIVGIFVYLFVRMYRR